MPPTGVIGFWGSIIGGLATLGIIAALASLQLPRSDEPLNDQTEYTTSLETGSPPGDKESHSSTGQISELDAFAEAEQALNQAKELVAGKGAPFLELPIGGLLDVVNACVTNEREQGNFGAILETLVALEGKTDSAMLCLHELTAGTLSNPGGFPASETIGGEIVSLLEKLAVSNKRIIAQARSSIDAPCADIVSSIRFIVQDFAVLNRVSVEEFIAAWAVRETELENSDAAVQRVPPPGPVHGLVVTELHPGETYALLSPIPEGSDSQDEVETEKGIGMDVYMRYLMGGPVEDLHEAINHYSNALAMCPRDHPLRPEILGDAGDALFTRFERLGQMEDLEEAINHHRDVFKLLPLDHPDHSFFLVDFANALQTRFGLLGQIEDLEEAIDHHRSALEQRPPGHADRFVSLHNLAVVKQKRFRQLGLMEDLEEAISLNRGALALLPPQHPHVRSDVLSNLASALHTRFQNSGRVEDLEELINHHRDGLQLYPPGHPDRFVSLNNLANAVLTRFEQTRHMSDLQEAIVELRNALEICPPDHFNRSGLFVNLANALGNRFRQSGQMADLDEAINHHRNALELCPQGHSNRSSSLNNLAAMLGIRFAKLYQIEDLDESISCHRSALQLRPPGHFNRPSSLNNLGATLQNRFDMLGQLADLEEAIIHHRDTLELRPLGHPDRSVSLGNLAAAMRTRFEQLNRREDIEEAIRLLSSGANDDSDTPGRRYSCAFQLTSLLEVHDRSLALDAYETALNLLQLSLAVYAGVGLRREALGANGLSPSLAMSAAAHAIEQGHLEKAVEFFEQGREMLWSNIRGYRHPIEEVRQADSGLAERFRTTSEQLEALATSSQLGSIQLENENVYELPAVSEARWARQRQLSSERDDIIQQIRRLGGFEHFLKAVPFHKLQAAATEGPIIIVNVARQRSDAIILRPRDAPILQPLSADGRNHEAAYLTILDLSNLLFEKRGKAGFSSVLKNTILKQLADILVSPILAKLESVGLPEKSRVWWCPTSALCALPIHAAGQLPKKYSSSYTPTLSALIAARRSNNASEQHPGLVNASAVKPVVLAVIHPGHPPKTKGEPDERLRTVLTERNVIEKAGGPGRVFSMVKADATREAILDALPHHPWVHFGCHGHLNTAQPFQSTFELEAAPLSLADLVQARLPNADFAFLAACDSATAGGISATPDEALHLAAAVQFCGVRSVVGTLWPMADEDGPKVAQVFWKHMFKENDARKSAEALQKVVVAMRMRTGPWAKAKDEGESLQRWANYIHIGA